MKLVYLTTARIPDEWAHVTQIMKMCEAFAKAGNEVELLIPKRGATRADDPFALAKVDPVFRITKLPCLDLFPGTRSSLLYWLRTFSFLARARRYLARGHYDLVYTREPLASGDLARTIFELHSLSSLKPAIIRSLKRARAVVAISHGLKDDLIRLGIPVGKLIVAPDGVDPDDFANPESKQAARARLRLPQDAKIALYIGLLDRWKGRNTLLAAAKILSPEVLTVVIGGFGEEKDLAVQHPEARFLGFRPYAELPDNQQAGDVLVLPNSGKLAISAGHTSPLKLFTYMASGIPIVASDLPSLREILSEENAYLVAPDDPEALARGVREALAEPTEAAKRASRAKEDVRRYTLDSRAWGILSSLK